MKNYKIEGYCKKCGKPNLLIVYSRIYLEEMPDMCKCNRRLFYKKKLEGKD